jgi:hypothetical protein
MPARTALAARRTATLRRALAAFAPIGLQEMAAVALLDRTDTKYLLTAPQLLELLAALQPAYRVLEVDGRRLSPYRTLYFDTPDFALYRSHQDGRRVRYKVLSRQYDGTPLAFFEVKHKTGPNHTRKERVATPDLVTQLTTETCEFLQGRIPLPAGTLEPKLWIDYRRITLVGLHTPERLTLDLDLSFSMEEKTLALPKVVIAELKSEGRPRTSPFVQYMRSQLVGASLIYPALKHNRFGRILRRIGQLHPGDYA